MPDKPRRPGRRVGGVMKPPRNVFAVYDRRTGRPRWYWQEGRSRPKADRSQLVRIPHEPDEPEFWAMAAQLNGERPTSDAGTFAACIRDYKLSPEWLKLARATREAYGRYLDFCKPWSGLRVADLDAAHVVALRNHVAASVSANTANQSLRAWSALLAWCILYGHASRNAAKDVPDLDHEPEITAPWPESAWTYVVGHAPQRIARMAVLGRATGQRISDLVRMRPADRKDDGITVPGRIRKTQARHWCALSAADIARLDGWACEPMQPYLHGDDGAMIQPQTIRAELRAWLASEAGAPARKADISPHGLRAMAVCDARLKGVSHQEIASLYRMSVAMVMRYSTHIDNEAAARSARQKMDGAGTSVKTFPANVKTPRPNALKS
jgi:integrase